MNRIASLFLLTIILIGCAASSNAKTTASNSSINAICQDIRKLSAKTPLKSINELKQRFLGAHNDIRKRYGVPALSWDENLARYAQKWAQYLKDNNGCEMKHRSVAGKTEGKQYGENLGINWTTATLSPGEFSGSPEEVIYGFSKECSDFNYDKNTCALNKICGHFTQVVWENSKHVGCGMVTCTRDKKPLGKVHTEIWVCNYDPPGNYRGQKPF